MAVGGLTFDDAKDELRLAVGNGVGATDPRVMTETNGATRELLTRVIPKNGMMTADCVVTNERILLPAEMEAGISFEVTGGSLQNGQTDVVRGWFEIVSQFAYVDPAMAHDNPVIDEFPQPDPTEPSILRRQYRYPGLADGAIVRVTGPKAYRPIQTGTDYLIVQNVDALFVMIQARDRGRNRSSIDDRMKHKESAVQMLKDEAQKHLLDPQNLLARKFEYQSDLNLPVGSLGQIRARMALEIPNLLTIGKSELTYFVNEAVMEAVDQFNFLGRTERYSLDEGPNQIIYKAPLLPSDLLSYNRFEVLRLLVISQRVAPTGAQPPPDATPTKEQAFQLLERDLKAQVESARTAAHLAATQNFVYGTRGWMVGRIGLEVPEALMYPVKRLAALVDRAEERGISMGMFKGMIEDFDAQVVRGVVLMPARVESILVATLNCLPVDIRSIYFRYLKNGPGDFACNDRIDDAGDVTLKDGTRRRRYHVITQGITQPTTTTAAVAGGGNAGNVVDGNLMIGEDARLVPLDNGLALEVKDDSGNWIRQTEWTE